ncbi:TonB-dependent receptor [Daejeonella oryzae]|uniref:TonB-dependent receptor n=1 Tax=Daejeonella oryzae TaxID=1122943 RepID=UPI000566A850|nr:TonB-dependent receptor [Daejeonella oryzae]
MNLKVILIALLILLSRNLFAETLLITGKVIDAQTKEPLPGATVTFPDLRLIAITDENGEFTFRNIPERGTFIIEVKYLGYKTITQMVDLSLSTSLNFSLQTSTIEAREVVITGSAFSSDNRKNSTAVAAIGKDQLINRPSGNLIDAIAKVPGVSQITTGGGISKPVIRGLSSNRVVTLVDGAKQEGQQWGDEHGIEVDQFNADRVEILRGAASLLYGSDALGGVINILDPLPPADGQIRGEILSNYSGNNGLTGNSAMLQGNSNGFIWQGRGSYKNAYSYNAPGGRIANTGYNETSLSGMLGLNKRWGFAHLNLSSFRNNIGLPDFERNSSGQFEDEDGNLLTDSDLKNRNPYLPFQDIRHYKIAVNSNIILGNNRLRSTLAYQNNQRREFEDNTTDPGLYFNLQTSSYDLKYTIAETAGWEPVLGASGSFQTNENKAEELLIPDYNSSEFGFFVYAKKSWLNTTFNLGARYDTKTISGISMQEDGISKFTDFKNSFSNLSGAAGFTQEFNDFFSFKANAGSAFRSPNIAELSSDGVHEGTFRYEIGNTNLKPEKSYYADLAIEFNNDKIHASLGLYNNYIDNYIYNRQTNNETILAQDETFPVYRYVQDNANLYGTEIGLDFHPIDLIHLENSFSYTHASNRETGRALPFIPAAVLRNELRLEPVINGRAKNSYFSVSLQNVFKQNRIDFFETASKGYTLVNAAMGTTFMLNKQPLRMNVSVNNLFNKAYYDHLSRFKPGRLDESNPSQGYYNQGRNISVGLYLPFVLR